MRLSSCLARTNGFGYFVPLDVTMTSDDDEGQARKRVEHVRSKQTPYNVKNHLAVQDVSEHILALELE